MNIIIFEDNSGFLVPFSINHSPIELRIGAINNFDRIKNIFSNDKIILVVRDSLKRVIKEKFPECEVNPEYIPKGVCLNGSAIFKNEHSDTILATKALSNNNSLISFHLNKDVHIESFNDLIDENIDVTKSCDIDVINNLWDIFSLSEPMIKYDYQNFHYNNNYSFHHSLIRINEDQIYIGNNSEIKAGIVLDATSGPIIIDDNVVLEHGVIVEGPCYIGKNSLISPNSIIRKNNIIGPMCKIGGEVTCCNILGYSNKVHDGFLGHSYIGEWVNIGAGTNNSNLKNNYSLVKVQFENILLDTKLKFLGSLIGDYTRISIGTNLNTGSYLGIGVNLFNHDFSKKYIPSFSWGDTDKVKIELLIETIIKMKKRRSCKLTLAEEKLINYLYK
tara:strand:+ start:5589 stop:6755 length:1167 start_codon:yes stop_codon:yes gene_type:complete